MISSEGKQRKGQSLFKRVKAIFRRRKNVDLPPSASISGIAQKPQQSDHPTALDRNVIAASGDSGNHLSPPSVSNVPTSSATKEVTDKTENPVLQSPKVNFDVGENAVPQASESTAATPLNEGNEEAEPQLQSVPSDTERTLERYKKAIEMIKKALDLGRDEWKQFELSEFGSLPLGDEQDSITLQLQIDRVLDSRMRASQSQNRTKWRKSKDLIEQCFRALAPFMKNILSTALSAAQVNTLPAISNYRVDPCSQSLWAVILGRVLAPRGKEQCLKLLSPDLGTRSYSSCGYGKDP